MIHQKKTCKACNKEKYITEFHADPAMKSGYRNKCKSCVAIQVKKQRYGITQEDYNQLLIKQNHRCAITGTHETELNSGLVIDHCHRTGKVRGLLSYGINTALGKFNDDPKLLAKAIIYLLSTEDSDNEITDTGHRDEHEV